MTIGQHISNLRGLIKQYSRNVESHTDQFLYEILVISRGDVLKDYLNKNIILPDSNYITVCVPLEKTNPYSCDCTFNSNCLVLKTKHKIPSVFSSTNKSKIKLNTLGGKVISVTSQTKWLYNKQETDYVASPVNGYYYFWNLPLDLTLIEITGAFFDPLEILEMTNSEDNNFLDNIFPLDTDLSFKVYSNAMKLLQIPMSVQQDITNDSNNAIKI